MEHLANVYISENLLSLSVVDFNITCHYLKNKTFRIHEMWALKNGEEVSCLWEGEDPIWEDKTDCLLETCNDYPILNASIEMKDGARLYFSYGRLSISNENQEILKLFSLKILDFYGYYAAKEIWDFCFDKKKEVNISQLIGIQSNEIDSHFRKL